MIGESKYCARAGYPEEAFKYEFQGTSRKRGSFFGSMSSVGVRFFESRSILVFIGILMFIRKIPVLWHGKQTFQCQSLN